MGTTGSGRELIAELVGADAVNDEITAHKTGALHISNTLGGEPVDTIFEIGGQDSKYISIENGIVTDFAMNEACAAGTGSFLEEQAEKLGISIKGEFAKLALSSPAPTPLGERCTVFMERDVTGWMLKGEPVPNVVAGLAYSIALNYLNRVVRGRKIGKVIYFQGGTAYNDSVAAAFAKVLGKKITVPPYNGVMGAIGMALIARQWHLATGGQSRFRGYDLSRLSMATRDFVCKACSNQCDIKEFTIEGHKSFWGDKCSDKFRKPSATGRKPVIEDLFAFRERLLEGVAGPALTGKFERVPGKLTVGLPRSMSLYDLLPFWYRYFTELGIQTVVSPVTNPKIAAAGLEMALAQPCYPIQVAHGHVARLLEMGVDYVLAAQPARRRDRTRQLLHRALLPLEPDAAVRAAIGAPDSRRTATRCWSRSFTFNSAASTSRKACTPACGAWASAGAANDRAVDAAYAAQRDFQSRLLEAGRQALETLDHLGEPGVLLVGRGYNIYDRSINCDIPRKLRHRYGANVIPIDFLVTGRESIADLHPNMYWTSGQKILAAARIASTRPNLHVIYLSNFKCGPDSYIKHFTREAAGAPLLVLQFDGHGNDAGYMTRCEAYLDSKGILRCYKPGAEPHGGCDRNPLKGKRIFIPPMAYGSGRTFAAAFHALGLDADITPPSDHRTRELGARYTSGDECYPAKVTVGDFMRLLEQPDIDPARVVLFMPTAGGPCRFGQYTPFLRSILEKNGYPHTSVIAPSSSDGYADFGDMASRFVRTAWRALLAADILQKVLLQTRPHEVRKGSAEEVYEECLTDVCQDDRVRAARSSRATARHTRRARALARSIPGRGSAARQVHAADRHRRRDLLPPALLLERGPGAPAGGIRGRRLDLRYHRVGLVHDLRAVPQAAAGGPAVLDGGGQGVGAQEGAEARRARAAGAVPRGFRGLRRAGRLRGARSRAALSACRRSARRDGAQHRKGHLPGEEGCGRNHRHQPVHLHERNCVRGDLPARVARPGRDPDPQLLLRRNAERPGPRPGRISRTGAQLPAPQEVAAHVSGHELGVAMLAPATSPAGSSPRTSRRCPTSRSCARRRAACRPADRRTD